MIISLLDIKTLLQITTTDSDDLILLNMPIVEKAICNYCNNDFLDEDFDYIFSNDFVFSIVDNSISLTNIGDDLVAGDNIRLYNSARNDRVLSIKTVSVNKLVLDTDIFLESDDRSIILARIQYPDDLKMAFVQMMDFTLQKYNVGLKNEKIDDYSITYNDLINGYPKSIMSGLQCYRQVFKPSLIDRGVECEY
jgi:hypothetical protein